MLILHSTAIEDVPTPNFSSQALLPHERISNLCKYKVRKRKSTIRKDDNSSQKNAKMGIEGGGLLDNLDTGKAGSKCSHPSFNTEKVRMEKAEKSVREQRRVSPNILKRPG